MFRLWFIYIIFSPLAYRQGERADGLRRGRGRGICGINIKLLSNSILFLVDGCVLSRRTPLCCYVDVEPLKLKQTRIYSFYGGELEVTLQFVLLYGDLSKLRWSTEGQGGIEWERLSVTISNVPTGSNGFRVAPSIIEFVGQLFSSFSSWSVHEAVP